MTSIFGGQRAIVVMAVLGTAAGLVARSSTQDATVPIRIVLVGDSTVTDDSGWGTGFRRLATPSAEIINTAANGRSSKSFIAEGRWKEALDKKGSTTSSIRSQRRAGEGS
jgi:pectinesterase